MSKNTVTVQDLADQFARLDAGEGWAFAALVACSCEKKAAGNLPNAKPQVASSLSNELKVSTGSFAEKAGTSGGRIRQLLLAWDMGAAQGFCVPSKDLNPADAATVMHPSDTCWTEISRLAWAEINKNQQPVDKSAGVKAELDRQADAARAAENAKRIAHLERQEALTKAKYEATIAENEIKAERMAAQAALVAERNATAKAEAIAKEEARRKHRAAEDAKAAAVVVAAAKERQAMVAEQKARKDAEAAAEAAARAEADAEREAAATSTLADFNEAVEQALTWLAEAKATGLKVSAMQESQLKRAVESIVPNGQLVRR